MKSKKKPEMVQEEQIQPKVKEEKPISDKYSLKVDQKSGVYVDEKESYTLGDPDTKVFCVKFDPEDKYIACACENGQVRVFNIRKRRLAYSILSLRPKVPFSYVKWRPSAPQFKTRNIFVTCNTEGEVQHFHLTSGKCLGTMSDEKESQLYCLDYNPDATKLAVCGSDPVIKVYDEEKRIIDLRLGIEQTQPPGHNNRVYSVKYHKQNPNLLLSGGWDRRVILWDIRQKKPEANQIYGPLITGDGIDFKENQGDYMVLTASWTQDNQLQKWDLRTCKLYNTVDWDQQLKTSTEPCQLYCGQFSKYDQGDFIIAGGSQSNEAKLFDTTVLDKAVVSIYDMSREINTLDFANNSNLFALSGGDGYIRMFEYHIQNN